MNKKKFAKKWKPSRVRNSLLIQAENREFESDLDALLKEEYDKGIIEGNRLANLRYGPFKPRFQG